MTWLLDWQEPKSALWKGPVFSKLQESFINNHAARGLEDETASYAISREYIAFNYIPRRRAESPGSG